MVKLRSFYFLTLVMGTWGSNPVILFSECRDVNKFSVKFISLTIFLVRKRQLPAKMRITL